MNKYQSFKKPELCNPREEFMRKENQFKGNHLTLKNKKEHVKEKLVSLPQPNSV